MILGRRTNITRVTGFDSWHKIQNQNEWQGHEQTLPQHDQVHEWRMTIDMNFVEFPKENTRVDDESMNEFLMT